jgi:dTDP-4-amino-4,6-dideoxygalactose transaminase
MIINYGKQHIDREDLSYVIKALKSEKITQGTYVNEFENQLEKKFKSRYCTVVNNGTSALYLSIKSLGIKKNSKVLVSPITFFSSAYTIIMNQLHPVFCDINLSNYNIDLNQLETKLKKDKSIKALVVVDYAGQPSDWDALNFIKKKYNLKIINDSCHAIGAKFKNDIGYACKYADLVTHSYHPVKNITTGEGGAILTNNRSLDKKIKLLRNHGIIRDKSLSTKNGLWYHQVNDYGFNFRITDFQCALGVSQLKKLDLFIKRRKKIAEIYNKKLKDISFFRTPIVSKNVSHAYHIYPLLIDFDKFKISKKKFFLSMYNKGISLQTHYIPVYRQNFLKSYNFSNNHYKNAESFYKRQVSLPIYYSLKDREINFIVNQIKNILDL